MTKDQILNHDAFHIVERAVFEAQCRNVREVSNYLRTYGFVLETHVVDKLIHAVSTQYKA